jgi:hypothetical protein
LPQRAEASGSPLSCKAAASPAGIKAASAMAATLKGNFIASLSIRPDGLFVENGRKCRAKDEKPLDARISAKQVHRRSKAVAQLWSTCVHLQHPATSTATHRKNRQIARLRPSPGRPGQTMAWWHRPCNRHHWPGAASGNGSGLPGNSFRSG